MREGDLVIVAAQDRWSRDTLFYLQSVRDLQSRGVRFLALAERYDPDTPEGKFASTIMAAVGEQERERIRVRTVGRRKALRDEGYYSEGLPPLGYRRDDGHGLVIVQQDADIIREIFRRCIAGESLRAISRWLQDHHPERHCWHHSDVRRMLRSRHYLGEVRDSRGLWIAGRHETIVAPSQWRRAQAALDSRRLGGRTPESPRTDGWLLRGLADCALCDTRMGAAYSRRAGPGYYACNKRLRGQCVAPYVRVDETDEAMAGLVLAQLERLRSRLATPAKRDTTAPNFAVRLQRLEQRRARLIDLATDGTITPSELRGRLARLDTDRMRIEAEAEAHEARAAAQSTRGRREALGKVGALDRRWKRAAVPVRRRIVQVLAETILLERGNPPRPKWRSVAELLAR